MRWQHLHAATAHEHMTARAHVDGVDTHAMKTGLCRHDAVEAVARPPTGKVGREVAAFAIGDEARDLTVDVDVDLEWALRLRVDGPSRNAERVAGVDGDVERTEWLRGHGDRLTTE